MSGAREPLWRLRPRSLQARLLLTVLGLVAGVWLVALVATWYDTRHELNELLDAHLAQTAALLSTQPVEELDDDAFTQAPTLLHRYQPRVAFQVWHSGRLVVRSEQAPNLPLSDRRQNGLADSQVGGQAWRVFTTPGREPGVLIQVGEQWSARRHILVASLRSVIWPALLALPLLVLGIWWAVRDAVLPLRRLGQGVAERRPQSLEQLSAQGVPPEVQPLVTALNGLFERMAEHLASERRFTADAAHELRTPIAAIRMQAQVVQGAASEGERQRALGATLQGCDRATHLVEQLLQLARLEAEEAAAPEASAGGTDLAAVARSVLAELAPQALARRQELALAAPSPLRVAMSAPLAAVLLRNLVDNALRYSPDGARVQVDLAAGPASLTVEDSGPGLPDEALARLGERFFRVLGTRQSGSGLGWSIVRRLARLHGLAVELDRSPQLGGLRVRIAWPQAAQG
ncbi:ATP-binding protein [Ramlibacter sp. 2FC]|uniref:ATP-binding protein n=1 Tax=Ramlibacter sp. 2FC TaxID=2502188 RepID=UPI00201D5DC8|nr:ATP-binding protein [Ramlibacter sp. 2FC]